MRRNRLVLLTTLGLLLAGCSGSELPDYTPTVTPAGGGGDASPTAAPDGPAVQGLAVADFFAATCAACHGQQREGLVGPALLPARLTQDDAFYADVIANGRPGTAMPSWSASGLTAEEIGTLVAFIRTEPGS